MNSDWRQFEQEVDQTIPRGVISIDPNWSRTKWGPSCFSKVPYQFNIEIVLLGIINLLKDYVKSDLTTTQHLLEKEATKKLVSHAIMLQSADTQITVVLYLLQLSDRSITSNYLCVRQSLMKAHPNAVSLDKLTSNLKDWSSVIEKMLHGGDLNKQNVSEVFEFMRTVSKSLGIVDYSLPAITVAKMTVFVGLKYKSRPQTSIFDSATSPRQPKVQGKSVMDEPIVIGRTKYDYTYRLN